MTELNPNTPSYPQDNASQNSAHTESAENITPLDQTEMPELPTYIADDNVAQNSQTSVNSVHENAPSESAQSYSNQPYTGQQANAQADYAQPQAVNDTYNYQQSQPYQAQQYQGQPYQDSSYQTQQTPTPQADYAYAAPQNNAAPQEQVPYFSRPYADYPYNPQQEQQAQAAQTASTGPYQNMQNMPGGDYSVYNSYIGEYATNPMADGQPLIVGDKNKIVAALLAFFLGALGIHNFYLGYTTRGVIQLLMTLVGWIIIFPPFVAAIWAFVEFILILVSSPGSRYHKDAKGYELQD
ncbi:TM2 domain-containing protein [Alloscardovia criceti]|uniref:TM2 domain-containing protein n=1 Tax=Alloscardovia criceti TaxID=356828 RepID=UPI0003777917|nr:TM2 domain-containing protein [Alloscardovia criceti]